MMFPVSLDFALAERIERDELMRVVEGRFPSIWFGEEEELLAHSKDWPDAVLIVRHEEDVAFPTHIDFVHFPRRQRTEKGDAVMPPTKLALLRELAALFECRVVCGASEFWTDEDVDSRYDCSEAFLCQGGRIFSGAVELMDAAIGARPATGWVPVDPIPSPRLTQNATLEDEAEQVVEMRNWRRTRSAPSANAQVIYPEGVLGPDDEDDFEDEPSDRSTWGKVEYSAEKDAEDEGGMEDEAEEEMEEYFQQIDQWSEGRGPTGSKQLISDGIALPAPDTLGEADLKTVLWNVINGLAGRSTYLHGTNHLSDRELYVWMWEEMLNETTMDLGGFSNAGFHVSPIGSGSDEDVRQTQIFYDDGVSRARWKASWPGDDIPAHEDPPYDRDRHLPKRDDPGF